VFACVCVHASLCIYVFWFGFALMRADSGGGLERRHARTTPQADAAAALDDRSRDRAAAEEGRGWGEARVWDWVWEAVGDSTRL